MPTSENHFISKLDRIIDDHLDDPALSIDAICEALGVSRSQLHRLLKEHTKLSTSRYIRQHRLLEARRLLTTTDLRVSEVCDAVGINNPQNFTTYFTEEFQVNPSYFRKLPGESSVAENGSTMLLVPSAENLPSRARPLFKRSPLYLSLAAGLLLLLGAGFYFQFKGPFSDSADNSLAVMPFINLSGADSDPACESIMDNIYTSVALIDRLRVIARSSSDQFESSPKSVSQIGSELGVANVLKGRFLKTGDEIQLKIDIIAAREGGPAWTKTYHGAYADIFDLTDEVVADVARQLNLVPWPAASENRLLARTQNLEAYNAFLQGRQLMLSRKTADLQESIVRLSHALSLDSTFAEAWAFKAAAILLLPSSGKSDSKEKNALTERCALNAIRLDPINSTAYGVLGTLYHITHQWQASENAFRIALQHNPNDAQANYWYSLLLRSMGRVDEAAEYSTRAVALDPLYPIILAGHILNCVYADRLDLAKKSIDDGRMLFDNSFAYHSAKAYYGMSRAEYSQAAAEFKNAFSLNPDDKGQIPLRMYCEAKRGNRREANLFLQSLTAATPWNNYQRAVVYAGLNEADSSLYYLKKASDEGYYFRDTKVIQVFGPYHKTLAFQAVLRRYNLAD